MYCTVIAKPKTPNLALQGGRKLNENTMEIARGAWTGNEGSQGLPLRMEPLRGKEVIRKLRVSYLDKSL